VDLYAAGSADVVAAAGVADLGTAPPGPLSHVMWLPEPVALMMATVWIFTVFAAPLISTSPHDPYRVKVESSLEILMGDWFPQS